MTPDELKPVIEQQLPGVSVTVEGPALIVGAGDLTAVCRYLKDSDRFALDYLSNLTAVDYLPAAPGAAQAGLPEPAGGEGRIDVVYYLCSMAKKHGPVVLKVKLPRENSKVASVTPVWRGAEYQEREVYDLFGVTFEGHPDLRRILMWDGFQGHPMRKDYKIEDQDTLEPAA